MRAIVTLIRGRRHGEIKAQIAEAEAALGRTTARAEHERWHLAGQEGCDGTKALAGRDLRSVAAHEPEWRLALILRERIPVKQRLATLRAELAKPETPDAIKIAAVESYDHRAELAARGYGFDREAYWQDPVGALKPLAGWVLMIPADDLDRATGELLWLGRRGFVEGNNILATLGEQARADRQ